MARSVCLERNHPSEVLGVCSSGNGLEACRGAGQDRMGPLGCGNRVAPSGRSV